MLIRSPLVLYIALALASSAHAADKLPVRPLFGDTHLHTAYSTDAGMIGNRLGPEEAYRYAMGEEMISSTGVRTRLSKPLDFLVIADHAENLGLAPMIAESNADLLKSEFGRKIHDLVKSGNFFGAYKIWGMGMIAAKDPLKGNEALAQNIWQRITSAAEKYNQPGRFTALHGFEWSSAPAGNNLHRVVVFRDGKEKTDKVLPFSLYESQDPEDLWKYLADYEQKTGGKVLAIPHNGNLSNGLMFDSLTFNKGALTRDYAERRQRWEPLYEITQIKGDGETHPALSPNDEFANFERWDKGSFGIGAKTPSMLPLEYARTGLKRGLSLEKQLGANPFKFGVIGSTDSHTSLASAEENNFMGKVSLTEPSNQPRRFNERMTALMTPPGAPDISMRHYQASASGLAAVWATENTREAIWDAMARKEVYGTTGTHMEVRLFAGDFKPSDLTRVDWVANGYVKGVPMGADLKVGAGETAKLAAPAFIVKAARAADGANLDRIQMVKGWLDAKGDVHEKVYDIAWSDAKNRRRGKDGKLTPVGNTVDVKNASYQNSIGAPMLQTFWKDPDFRAGEPAFYYVRVLEIPTPRWTVYDAKTYGVDLPDGVPTAIQERAYTSPVWVSSQRSLRTSLPHQ